ncbi:MAG: pyridoxal-phosphate dependent enzyme, partial [Candidatus Hodarchaeota archaeon]
TEHPDRFFMPDQFSSKANILAHYETTTEEIWRYTNGTITHFICGLGTTGTALGVSKRLKTHLNADLKVIVAILSPDTPIPGLKNFPEASYTPKIWQPKYIDEIHQVRYEEAEEMARLVALKEGLSVGSSSDAILDIALKKAKELEKGVIVVIAPDGGDRYLSTTLCTPDRYLECAQRYAIRCTYFDGKSIEKAPVPSVSR